MQVSEGSISWGVLGAVVVGLAVVSVVSVHDLMPDDPVVSSRAAAYESLTKEVRVSTGVVSIESVR